MTMAIALALAPLALFLIMVFLAMCRVVVARFTPDCRLKRILLTRVDSEAYGKSGGTGVGSGHGKLSAELTQEFRALYK